MSAVLKKFCVLAILSVLVLPAHVYADVAPDPVTRSISYLPILYGLIEKTGPSPFGSIASLLSLVILMAYLRMANNE